MSCVCEKFVPVLSIVTTTPGSTAPDSSRTVPSMTPSRPLYVNGFGGTTIQGFSAPALTGPWTRHALLYSIPAPLNNTERTFCYAVKAHPQLARNASEIVFSYMCNAFGGLAPLTHRDENDVYIPNFVRVVLSGNDCDSSKVPATLRTLPPSSSLPPRKKLSASTSW